MIILLDMDDTGFHWGRYNDTRLDLDERLASVPRTHQRTVFDLYDGTTEDQRELIDDILNTPGFYAALEPVDGFVEAVHAMDALGHIVFFVSTPWTTNATCASDKLASIEKWIGPGWAHRVVLTGDKTLVHGDVLFDDKPVISGAIDPTWKRIIFDQPWNRLVAGPRITDWANWSTAIDHVLTPA